MTSSALLAVKFPRRLHPLRRRQLRPLPTALRRHRLQAPAVVVLTITPRRHPLSTPTPRRRRRRPPAEAVAVARTTTHRREGTTQRRLLPTQLCPISRFTTIPLRCRPRRRLRR